MSSRRDGFRRELRSHDVLFSCEGTAEKVIIQRLVEDARLLVPEEHVVRDLDDRPYTDDRTVKKIQRDFLGFNYPHGLMIVRIVDVNPGSFVLPRLYREQVLVRDVVTRSEIEVLVLVREGAYQDWYQHGKSKGLSPSQWCIQHLGLKAIKTRGFLEDYWSDPKVLVKAIRDYTSGLGGHKDEQLNLNDLLR